MHAALAGPHVGEHVPEKQLPSRHTWPASQSLLRLQSFGFLSVAAAAARPGRASSAAAPRIPPPRTFRACPRVELCAKSFAVRSKDVGSTTHVYACDNAKSTGRGPLERHHLRQLGWR